MSLTKLSLAGKNFIIPGQGKFVRDTPPVDGKIANLFYSVPGAGEGRRIAANQ
jgi:hypothetical protein